jgi:hypothetical protein
VRQLEEIVELKDNANKDFKRNVRHLEDALAETKMNLEFMHSKWRDEAASHEQWARAWRTSKTSIAATRSARARRTRALPPHALRRSTGCKSCRKSTDSEKSHL